MPEEDDATLLAVFWEGVHFAYAHPDEEPATPYAEPFLSAYLIGVQSGKSAASGEGVPAVDVRPLDPPYDGPSIGPWDGSGESWDEYQKGIQEMLEPLFHKHMPHTEIEPLEVPPVPPGPPVMP